MTDDLRSLELLPLCSSSVTGIDLPDSDNGLDALLEQAVSQRYGRAFTFLGLAALEQSRPVDARHLINGADLIEEVDALVAIAGGVTGDAAGALVEAVRLGRMHWNESALALVAAAMLAPPDGRDAVVREARALARQPLGFEAQFTLATAALVLDDDDLSEMIVHGKLVRSTSKDLREQITKIMAGSPADALPEKPRRQPADGRTLRRATERVGRNAPCPCGSGKKYKKCCMKSDQERLRDSSHVPGVTRTELRMNPERHLDRQALRRMSGPEVARLDPALVDPTLHHHLLWTLVFREELDAVERFLSTVPWKQDWDDLLLDAMDLAAEMGDGQRVHRLMALRGEPRQDYEPCLAARLLALDSERGPMFELIEEHALEHVDDPVEFAYQMLISSPALGIHVARGACLVPSSHLDADTLLTRLLEVRDRLGLSPDDPVEPAVDEMLEERDEDLDDDDSIAKLVSELDTRAARMDAMRSELAETREQLAELEQQIERERESKPADEPPAKREHEPPDELPAAPPDTDRLRRRIKELEAMIRERGAERRELRKEISELRSVVSVEQTFDRTPSDDEDWEPLAESTAPVRVPVFSRPFLEGLNRMPLPARRAAMKLVGLAAAGDPSALRNMLRLKRNPVYARLRAGQYRVIVEPRVDDLQVVDVVHRKDLAQCIASL